MNVTQRVCVHLATSDIFDRTSSLTTIHSLLRNGAGDSLLHSFHLASSSSSSSSSSSLLFLFSFFFSSLLLLLLLLSLTHMPSSTDPQSRSVDGSLSLHFFCGRTFECDSAQMATDVFHLLRGGDPSCINAQTHEGHCSHNFSPLHPRFRSPSSLSPSLSYAHRFPLLLSFFFSLSLGR